MHKAKFAAPQSRGIFEGDPAGYAKWADWAEGIRQAARALDARHALSSRGVPEHEVVPVAAMCIDNVESAIHVVAGDMLSHGASWTHLKLMRNLAGISDTPYPDLRDVAGRFTAQVARVLGWYDGLCHPAPQVTIVTRHRRHEVRVEEEGSMEVSAAGDGLLVRLALDPDDCSVTLGPEAAEEFVSGLEHMLAEDPHPLRSKHFMLGRDDGDGDRSGLAVSEGNMGEPYREVVNFKVLAPEWETLAPVQVLRHDVEDLALACRAMLDGPEPEAPAPGMR